MGPGRWAVALLLAAGPSNGGIPPVVSDSFFVFIIVMVTCAVALLLALVVVLAVKMGTVERRLDEISESANEFVKMGVKFFRDKH